MATLEYNDYVAMRCNTFERALHDMGQYDFTYEIPDNFHSGLVRFLTNNGGSNIAQNVARCSIDYQDLGYALYAGIRGDNWNKNALRITIGGSSNDISALKPNAGFLRKKIEQFLRPPVSGFLVKDVELIVLEDDIDISLPEIQGETYETLTRDIYDALGKGEPTLVLDRLHTFSTKYLREICSKKGIPITDEKGNYYPLHNLIGPLAKSYKSSNMFQSDFVAPTLKMCISVFEKYNSIRNDNSFAHDNPVLNKVEATYVVRIITATLSFIHDIEE